MFVVIIRSAQSIVKKSMFVVIIRSAQSIVKKSMVHVNCTLNRNVTDDAGM